MGFAVAAGIYQELGQVSKQEDIDVHVLAGVVQRLLDSMPKNAKADVEQVSCIYCASLKLDAYPTEKLHGLPEDLGTRLIYCGCVVRNTLIRSLTGHSIQGCNLCRTRPHWRIGRGLLEFQDSEVQLVNGQKVLVILVNAQPINGQRC